MFLWFLSLLSDEERRLVNRLYNEYKNAMFDAAYDILKDDGLSEDAVHTAFVNVSDHLHKLKDVKSVRTKAYLLTVVKNAAKKMYNIRKPVKNYEDIGDREYLAADCGSPQRQMLGKLSRQRMVKCLQEMKPKYRDVLIMKYYLEKDDRLIAKVLGLSDSAVRKRLERARKDFILRYGGDDGEE